MRSGRLEEVLREELKPNYLAERNKGNIELLDEVLAMGLSLGADVFCGQSTALMNRPDSSDTLARIDCPTLVLCGEEDQLCPVELHEFMAGASNNDLQAHDRFWDENLVYTSSTGDRYGKREIMAALLAANEQGEEGPDITYLAENIEVQQFGDTAVVAFRLIGVTHDPGVLGQPKVDNYYNTGTFVRRDGAWRAVAWQATRIPD